MRGLRRHFFELKLTRPLPVHATIMVPQEFIGDMMELCNDHRGIELEYTFVEATDRAVLRYQLPLSEIATEFFSSLKSRYVALTVHESGPDWAGLAGVKDMRRLITRMPVMQPVIW